MQHRGVERTGPRYGRQRHAALPSGVQRPAIALCSGAMCHACFALAIGSMMVAMFFGMSRSLGILAAPWSWIANALALAQFPIMHSFLLTRRGRAFLAHLAPAGTGTTLSSTTYATLASLQIFALFGFWSPSRHVWWQAHGSAFVALTVLYAGSWLLLGKAVFDAGLALQTGSLGWVALLRKKNPVYPKMPQTGLFRLSRQPIYVAFTLTLWTVPTWTPDQLIVAVTLTSYCLVAPLFKEARFRRIYGSPFDAYARDVPYWLPWPRKRRSTLAGTSLQATGVDT